MKTCFSIDNNLKDLEILLKVLAIFGIQETSFLMDNMTISSRATRQFNLCHPHNWDITYSTSNNVAQYMLCIHPSIPVTECHRGQYMCSDGSRILDIHVSDGIKDCKFGDDELHCPCIYYDNIVNNSTFCISFCHPSTCICPPMYFQCHDGGCIQYSLVCDGVGHCIDWSDEFCKTFNKATTKSKTVRREEQFSCSLNFTIPHEFCNDFIPDCPDSKDEEENKHLLQVPKAL